METILRQNAATKTGYELVVINDDNVETVHEVTWYKGDPNTQYLKLPENPANRQWFKITTWDAKAVNGQVTLAYKATRVLGARTQRGDAPTPRRTTADDAKENLTPEEYQEYQRLLDKIALKKKIEAAKKAYEDAKAFYESLLNENKEGE